MEVCTISYEVVWLQKLFDGIFDDMLDSTRILFIDQSCMKFEKEPEREKHEEAYFIFVLCGE